MVNYENISCTNCKKTFRIEYIQYPSSIDDKRDISISCPYCNAFYKSRRLRGNEDINVTKVKK